ncbi:MAG TPA: cell division protein BolA [Gammaproteobacteria bacterium]|nr:BolA/IbaG family iron-sulfur metabolism protein [Gammaproteobacteria bacterium]MDP6732182.1 BolA/IbaG family iron-sulfur metabolism protein [Gammaproteobacteria bacterium]HAJ75276.1 cell division protein BolA [Gammaproteobacteria bacterium]
MDCDQIRELLAAALPDCNITVEGGDGKYLVTAVGDVFDGLNAVKRQQTIYQILNPHIVSGAIHAVTMQLMTEAEHSVA